jgi:CPA2 family monovalent cation:H+ antiporter-2
LRRLVLPGALIQLALGTAFGAAIGRWAGWSAQSCCVFGFAIAVPSTVVALRALCDRELIDSVPGHVAHAWLIASELCSVLVLVLMPALSTPSADATPSSVALSAAIAVSKIVLLVGLTAVAGRRAIPAILRYVENTRSRELFTLAVLVLALGVAVLAAELFGASFALGAFLAGVTVGQSKFASRAASEALPIRDALAVLFFVSVGMFLDPAQIVPNAALSTMALGVILLGRGGGTLILLVLLRQTSGTATKVAASLAQIGEFSFVIASEGRDLGVFSEQAMQVVAMASIASIALNPLLWRGAEPLARWLESHHHHGSSSSGGQGTAPC